MCNVFIVGSPWHATLASAMSNSNEDLFIVESVSDSSYAMILKILSCNSVLMSVSWKDFEVRSLISISAPLKLSNHVKKLQAKYSTISCTSLFVFNLNSPASRIAIDCIEYEELIKVEDGMCDYLGFQFYKSLPFYKESLRTLYTILNRSYKYFSRSDNIQPNSYYLFFPERYPNKDLLASKGANFFSLFDFKELILSKLMSLYGSKINNDASLSRALIICQSLYEDGNCDLNEEVGLYNRIISELSKRYDVIDVKLHPRTCLEKTLLLEIIASNNPSVFLVKNDVPVECYLLAERFSAVVGVWSNPIILGVPLFSISTYSILPFLVSNLDRFNVSVELIKTHERLSVVFPEFYKDFYLP